MAAWIPLAAPSVAAIYPLDVLECHEFLILRAVGINDGMAVYQILGAREDETAQNHNMKIVAFIEVVESTGHVRIQLTGVQGVFTAEGGLLNLDSTMKIFCPNNHGAFGSINKTRLMDYTIPSTQLLLEWIFPKNLLHLSTQINMKLQNIGKNSSAFAEPQRAAMIARNSMNIKLRFYEPHLTGTKRFLAAMAMLKVYYGLYQIHLEACIPVGMPNRMDPITPLPPTIDILEPLADVVTIRPVCRDGESNIYYDIIDVRTQKIVVVAEASMPRNEIRFRDTCGVMQYRCSVVCPLDINVTEEYDVFTHDGSKVGKVRYDNTCYQHFQTDAPTPAMIGICKNISDRSYFVIVTDGNKMQVAKLRACHGKAFHRVTILPNISNVDKALILTTFIHHLTYSQAESYQPSMPDVQQYPFREIRS